VRLVDVAQPMLDRARASIEKSLGKLVEKGSSRPPIVMPHGTPCHLHDGRSAQRRGLRRRGDRRERRAKRALFTSLDAIVRRDVILASNTSSISITVLGAATKRPDKVLGMHFMNPVPLMTLVEVIRGRRRRPSHAHRVKLCARLGKTPIEAADYPASSRTGF